MSRTRSEIIDWVLDDFGESGRGRGQLEEDWLEYWKMYLSKDRHPSGKYQSKAVSPHGAMAVRQLVPLIKRQILSTRPFIRAVPRKPGLDDQAALLDTLMDYWIDISDARHEVLTLALKEAVIFGIGWAKVWHHMEDRLIKREVEVPLGLDENGEPLVQEIEELDILYSGPKVAYVPLHEVFPDMTATSLEEARFIAHRFFRKKSELEQDSLYDQDRVAKIEVDPAKGSSRNSIPLQQIFEEQRRRVLKIPVDSFERHREALLEQGDDIVELIEYVADGKVITVANRSVIIREGDLDHPLPWIALVPDPIPGELFGKSVLADAKPLLDQRDFLIRALFDNVASVIYRRFIGLAGSYDPRTVVGPPNSVIKVRTPGALEPLQQQDISGSVFGVLTHLERDIERGTGLSEPLSAIGPSGPVYNETATAAMAKQESGLLFIGEIVANVERGLKRMAEVFFDIESNYFGPGQWLRLSGEEGGRWRQVDTDKIAGDWDFRVVGAEYAAGKQAQIQALGIAMPWLMQIKQMEPRSVDLIALARSIADVVQLDNREKIVPGGKRDLGPKVEHEVMMTGQWVNPEEDEDHQRHLQEHMQELQVAMQQGGDEGYINRLMDHVQKTQEMLLDMQARAQAIAGMAMNDQQLEAEQAVAAQQQQEQPPPGQPGEGGQP